MRTEDQSPMTSPLDSMFAALGPQAGAPAPQQQQAPAPQEQFVQLATGQWVPLSSVQQQAPQAPAPQQYAPPQQPQGGPQGFVMPPQSAPQGGAPGPIVYTSGTPATPNPVHTAADRVSRGRGRPKRSDAASLLEKCAAAGLSPEHAAGYLAILTTHDAFAAES